MTSPMECSPRLEAMAKRAALPIKVRFAPFNDGPRQWHMIVQRRDNGSYGRGFGVDDMAGATRAYLALCDSLPATVSPDAVPPTPQEPGTAGVDTPSTPALSSPVAP